MMARAHFNIKEAARRLGVSERHVRRLCLKGRLPGAIKDGDDWRIPETADTRLRGIKTAGQLMEPGDLAGVAVRKREEALRRLGLIQAAERFIADHMAAGNTRTGAIKIYAEMQGAGARSLQRWMERYRAEGLMGLVDGRGGGAKNETISPEAWEYFKSIYLDQKRWSVKLCWQTIHHINRNEGRRWLIPSLRVMHNIVKRDIPLPVSVLHREGQAAYDARCSPYVMVDPESVAAGEVWVGDHHQFNCWIKYRNRWIRPWITAWQDMRSRLIAGRDINAGPNQTTILKATKRAMEKYGPPDSVKIDNGRDYDSELWTGMTKAKRRCLGKGYLDEKLVAGIYGMLDVSVSFAIPYHPQAKPIERFFDTLDRQFTRTIPTYCGKGVDQRPDYLADMLNNEKAIAEAYSLEEFAALAGRYIEEVYNQQSHTGEGMAGQTPQAVFAARPSRRVLREGVLDLLMRVWSGELTVGKNGVRFKELWYGQYEAELLSRQGRKVRVAYDPDDLSSVYIYEAATMRLICMAQQARLVGYGRRVSEDDLREGMKQKARAKKAAREYVDTRKAARMDLPALALTAQAESALQAEPERTEPPPAILKPVATVMDDQVRDHQRVLNKKILQKAAGAERLKESLNFDLAQLAPPTLERKKLFGDG